nr:transcriptional regulator [Modestobacter marinus]
MGDRLLLAVRARCRSRVPARPAWCDGRGGRGAGDVGGAAQQVGDPDLRRCAASRAVTAVEPRFDAVVHAPPRLQICGLLAAVDTMEFAAVRDAVSVSDSVLSKHVKQLEEAGYVQVRKATIASRQRTSLALTRAGRAAFGAHVAELRRIAGL